MIQMDASEEWEGLVDKPKGYLFVRAVSLITFKSGQTGNSDSQNLEKQLLHGHYYATAKRKPPSNDGQRSSR